MYILWSRDGNLDNKSGSVFTPNHFVPLIEQSDDPFSELDIPGHLSEELEKKIQEEELKNREEKEESPMETEQKSEEDKDRPVVTEQREGRMTRVRKIRTNRWELSRRKRKIRRVKNPKMD